MEDKSSWMTSARLARILSAHRDNDVKVVVRGCAVPIASARYVSEADQIHIELIVGEDLRTALSGCDD